MRSPWSEPATAEAGLLSTGDWTARFVSPRELGGLGAPAPVLRAALDLPDNLTPHALINMGYGAKDPPRRPHRPVSELVVRYD